MLTPADKKWIEEKLVKEVKPVRDSVDLLRGKLTTVYLEKFNDNTRLDSVEASQIRVEEKVDRVLTMLDGFAGKVADLEQENKMGGQALVRHTAHIKQLAKAGKVSLAG
ncbi:MAG: hypothetical protein WC030_01735 [Candidatus Paceibacterota bacterium]